MTHLFFKRESECFDDILKDAKSNKIRTTITFSQFLLLDLEGIPESITSFFMLKYSEDVVGLSNLIPDRSPIPYKDYIPQQK